MNNRELNQLCHRLNAALERATRPLLVLGYGAVLAQAGNEIARLAGRLPHLRIAATPKSKGIFAETNAQYVGVIGFAGHDDANRYLFEAADYVVIVGTRLGELTSNNWDPRWHTLNTARVDVADVATSWCRSGLFIRADARQVLRQISGVGRLKGKAEAHSDSRLPVPQPGSVENDAPLHPKVIMQVVNAVLPCDAHVFSGIGNTMAWAVHYLRFRRPDRWHVNLCAGSMGHAIPAAIGAALAGKTSLAVIGDAEFLMTGYELHTAVENRLNLTVVVLNDEGHGMVRVGSRAHCGGLTPSFDFHRAVDIVAVSRGQGAQALRVTTLDEFVTAFTQSLRSVGPTVIEVPIGRDLVPPLGARLDSLGSAFGIGKEGSNDVHQ